MSGNEFIELSESVRRSPLRWRIVQRLNGWRMRVAWWVKHRHGEAPF